MKQVTGGQIHTVAKFRDGAAWLAEFHCAISLVT